MKNNIYLSIILCLLLVGSGFALTTNVSPTGTVTMSTDASVSNGWGVGPTGANDLNTQTYTHSTGTENDPNAWVQIALPSEQDIERITVYNRYDCCELRLRDIYIIIRDVDDTTEIYRSALLNPGNEMNIGRNDYLEVDLVAELGNAITGGIVIVQRIGDVEDPGHNGYVLSVGEVEIFATAYLPIIETQPEDAYVYLGDAVDFSVSATDPMDGTGANLTYQWVFDPNTNDAGDETVLTDGTAVDGTVVAGATTDVLSLTNIQGDAIGFYFCEVKNAPDAEASVSNTAQLAEKMLLGHWPFDGNTTDVVGGNDGTTTTDTFIDGQPGLGGKAIRFEDNEEGYQDMTEGHPVKINGAPYSGQTVFTLTWWDFIEVQSNVQDWVTMVGLGNGVIQNAVWGGSNLYGTFYGAGATQIDGPAKFDNRVPGFEGRGNWHFHALIFDGSKFWRFIDGVSMNPNGITTYDYTTFPEVVWVGNEDDQYGTFNNAFDGAIDDLKLYNYPMAADEVATIYTDIAGGWVCNAFPAGDFNNDCIVNLEDLATVAASWMVSGEFPQM